MINSSRICIITNSQVASTYFNAFGRQSKGQFEIVFLQSVNEDDSRKFPSVDDSPYTALVGAINEIGKVNLNKREHDVMHRYD